MIGHQQILALRKAGKRPAHVFVEYGTKPPRARRDYEHPERQIAHGFYPTVYVECGEKADLRFLVGLQVSLSLPDWSEESYGFLEQVAAVNPKFVVATASLESAMMMIWRGKEWEVTCL